MSRGRKKLPIEEKKLQVNGSTFLKPSEIELLGGMAECRKQANKLVTDYFKVVQNRLNESFKFTTECNDKFKSNVILVEKANDYVCNSRCSKSF